MVEAFGPSSGHSFPSLPSKTLTFQNAVSNRYIECSFQSLINACSWQGESGAKSTRGEFNSGNIWIKFQHSVTIFITLFSNLTDYHSNSTLYNKWAIVGI